MASMRHAAHLLLGFCFLLVRFPLYGQDFSAAAAETPRLTPPGVTIEERVPWGVRAIGASALHDLGFRGEGIRIAVLDSGVSLSHPDLAHSLGDAISFIGNTPSPLDDFGHGTHLSGIIAAGLDDSGVVGVAPGATLHSLKVIDGLGRLSPPAVEAAIEWAISNDIDILNLSFKTFPEDPVPDSLFEKAHDAGLWLVSSAGNRTRSDDPVGLELPAALPWVLSVGAIAADGSVPDFSQRDPRIDFVAPGVEIFSTEILGVSGITTTDGASYEARRIGYAAEENLSGAIVFCGLGRPGECPAEVEGAIALVERGELTFAEKALNATSQGAAAVVIYNHHPDDHPQGGMVAATFTDDGEWPTAVFVTRSTGDLLRSLEGSKIWLGRHSFDVWGARSGTSMAAAHLSGAIALLLQIAPDASRDEILSALIAGSRDGGPPGPDEAWGHGSLDVFSAARILDPSIPRPRRRGTRRGD